MIGMVKGVKSTLSQVKATLKTKSQNLHAPIALITKDHSWVSFYFFGQEIYDLGKMIYICDCMGTIWDFG